MRTRLRGKFSLLFLMFGLLLAFPALALADILKNDVANDVGVGQIRVYAADDPATSIGYYVDATNGCDPADGTPATVSLSVSEFNNAALDAAHTGVVTIVPNSLTFSQCDVKQQVNFSTTANAPRGDYTITADATDSGADDTYNENPATFKLRVIDNCNGQEPGPGTDNSGSPTDGTCDAPNNGGGGTNQPPTADAGGPYTVDEGSSTNALNGTGSDPENGPLTYAWDLDNDGQYDDSAVEDPNFDASNLDGPSIHTVRLQVTDDQNQSAVDEATVNVTNVKPTITSISTLSQGALTGNQVTFTGQADDPANADDAAGFTWQWFSKIGSDPEISIGTSGPVAGTPTSTSFPYTFSQCGSYNVSATATDKDNAVSDPASLGSNPFRVYNGGFLPPIDTPATNLTLKGKVLPIKISVSCNGQAITTGLTPSIKLLNGDVAPGTEVGTDEVEAYSSSAADQTGWMRPVDGGYIYNVQVPGDASVKVNQLFTVRVNPFATKDPLNVNPQGGAMYALLKIKK